MFSYPNPMIFLKNILTKYIQMKFALYFSCKYNS